MKCRTDRNSFTSTCVKLCEEDLSQHVYFTRSENSVHLDASTQLQLELAGEMTVSLTDPEFVDWTIIQYNLFQVTMHVHTGCNTIFTI